jgi:organic hydroperoxide reductase OsmC/OhrA
MLPEGVLSQLSEGAHWVSEVTLNPKITFTASQEVMPSALARIREPAHQQCFIANSTYGRSMRLSKRRRAAQHFASLICCN